MKRDGINEGERHRATPTPTLEAAAYLHAPSFFVDYRNLPISSETSLGLLNVCSLIRFNALSTF